MKKPNCEQCPLNGRTKVYGEGSRILEVKLEDVMDHKGRIVLRIPHSIRDNEGKYEVVVVGMDPGEEEVKGKRPFIGPSGALLRSVLTSLGIKEVYITNVLYCRPETEEERKEAFKYCGDRVIEEVLERQPKLTIALGDFPFRTFVDTDYKITEVEGRVIPSKVGPLLAIPHPAYYLRNPNRTMDFIESARSSVRYLSGAYDQCVDPTFTVVNSENLGEVLNTIDKYEWVGMDCETTGLHPYAWDPDTILEMGLAVTIDHAYIVPEPMIIEFKEILETKKICTWNGQFDTAFLRCKGIKTNNQFDGLLAHYTLDERAGHRLKKVAKMYLGCDDWESKIKPFVGSRKTEIDAEADGINFANIPTEIRYKYLACDATRTLQLMPILHKGCIQKLFYNLLMPSSRMFTEVIHEGIRVDPIKLMTLQPHLEEEIKKSEQKIYELTGRFINPNSPAQIKQLLYEDLKYPVDPFFGATTGKEALALFEDDPLIDAILTYRQMSKMRGTYVVGIANFVDRNYKIHPWLNLHKAVSGRLSSDEPSIMNLKGKSRVKEIFLPDRPEDWLVIGDIKGNELNWYYINSLDPELGAAFASGRDPHNEVSTIAYGPELAKAKRTEAKAVVFGRLYGRSTTSIEKQVGAEKLEALIKAVDNLFPSIKEYRRKVEQELNEKKYVESYFGRRLRYPLLTRQNKTEALRVAVNFMQQSSGSDTMLYSFLYLWENKDRLEIRPFWPVHDSLTSNKADTNTKKIKDELEKFCYDLVEGKCKFTWEMDYGKNWAMEKEATKVTKEEFDSVVKMLGLALDEAMVKEEKLEIEEKETQGELNGLS